MYMNVAQVYVLDFLLYFLSFIPHCVLSIREDTEDAVLNFSVLVSDERAASLQLTRSWNKWKLRR